MARGGINKALVQQAREAVLAKGQNPSIDAVRVELGNTGSKSTIHRYLKELEEAAATRLDDQILLSEPIKELAGRLASRLREEALALVNEAEERHAAAIKNWEGRYGRQSEALSAADQQVAALKAALEASQTGNRELQEELQALTTQVQHSKRTINELEARADEKDRHIASLEEKHTHSREAMEHYRQSVKEQREQDARQHEHQVQQLQVELRQLNQTLSIKQADITGLNRDNARLATELRVAQQSLSRAESALTRSDKQRAAADAEVQKLAEAHESAQTKAKELQEAYKILDSQNESLSSDNRTLNLQIAKLESKVEVQDDWINRMKSTETTGPGSSQKTRIPK